MEQDKNLTPTKFNQTKIRGTNDQEYQIYVACAESLGWRVKSYQEWLSS